LAFSGEIWGKNKPPRWPLPRGQSCLRGGSGAEGASKTWGKKNVGKTGRRVKKRSTVAVTQKNGHVAQGGVSRGGGACPPGVSREGVWPERRPECLGGAWVETHNKRNEVKKAKRKRVHQSVETWCGDVKGGKKCVVGKTSGGFFDRDILNTVFKRGGEGQKRWGF